MARRRVPGYLRIVRASRHDHRVKAMSIRWWHPGMVWVVVKALLRAWGILPMLCASCGGAGRVVKSQMFRRERCPACQGTGRERRKGR